MSLSKSFTEEQVATIQSWADQGDNLSQIQKKLSSEMEAKVTYMELRFLLDDLGVKLKEETPEEPAKPEPANDLEDDDFGSPGELPAGNQVRVTISALQRPGALISGTAAFSGGEEAEWWLDQSGQLGMSPKSKEFRPNQEQMISFQRELQKAVQSRGF